MPTLKSVTRLYEHWVLTATPMDRPSDYEVKWKETQTMLQADYRMDPVLFAEAINTQGSSWHLTTNSDGQVSISSPYGIYTFTAMPVPVFLPVPKDPWWTRLANFFKKG